MNNPKVTLLSITGDIQKTMGQVWEIAKDKKPLNEIHHNLVDVDKILSADLPTSEYINTIWCVEGMPRAFWDQFDRSRHAAFWEQSVRILDLTAFADNGEYWVPPSIFKSGASLTVYNDCMQTIQDTYNVLTREYNIPSEDARGVLPLHINVRGTCCINLRALKALISNRICFIAQGSYWLPVVHGMMLELAKVLPPKTLRSMANLPCYKKSSCPIESNVVTRLTNEDPNPVCPIYLKRFAQQPEEAKAFTYAKHPEYDKIKEQYYELIRSLGMEE